MTNLEQALASTLHAIEEACRDGHARIPAALLQRKERLCAALAAPEHAWPMAQVHAADEGQRCASREQDLALLLAHPCPQRPR